MINNNNFNKYQITFCFIIACIAIFLSACKKDDDNIPGEIKYITSRGNENRYSYYYEGKLVWTFGITRSPKKKEIDFKYVPRQMGLNNKEYRELEDCTKTKEDYNKLIIEKGKI